MPRVSDYGGHGQERKRGSATKDKGKLRSYECLHCGRRFFMTHAQATRKSGVHCVQCGGPGDETQASVERRLGMKKKHIPKMVGKLGELDKSTGRVYGNEVIGEYVCRFCYTRFRSRVGLKLHYEESHDFFEEF